MLEVNPITNGFVADIGADVKSLPMQSLNRFIQLGEFGVLRLRVKR